MAPKQILLDRIINFKLDSKANKLKIYYVKWSVKGARLKLKRLVVKVVGDAANSCNLDNHILELNKTQISIETNQDISDKPEQINNEQLLSEQYEQLHRNIDKLFNSFNNSKRLELASEASLKILAHKLDIALEYVRNNRRPRRLLIVVNPFGGKGRALELFRKFVQPLLELAKVDFKLVVTQHANHARNMLEDRAFALDKFHGVVGVGGDGMFSELMNGLLFRFNLKSPPIPIGIISAGSTDANSFGLIGTNDVVTATLNILLGKQIKVDVCSLHSIKDDKIIRFASTFAAYGYFGDVVRESEKLRWLGPSRYDVTGINSLLKNRTYPGQLRILVSEADGSPLDSDRCHSNCKKCKVNNGNNLNNLSSTNEQKNSDSDSDSDSNSISNINSRKDGKSNDNDKCHTNFHKAINNEVINDISFNDHMLKHEQNVDLNKDISKSNFLKLVQIDGPFIGVNAAVTACRCPQTRKGFAPSNHLANGCLDLIVVRTCSRLQYLRYLLRTGWTKKSPFQLKYVEAFRCREFEFIVPSQEQILSETSEPSYIATDGSWKSRPVNNELSSNAKVNSRRANSLSNSTSTSSSGETGIGQDSDTLASSSSRSDSLASSWNVDGEVLNEHSIRVRVNNQLLRVFGTGEP